MELLLKEWKVVLILVLTGLLTLTAWLLDREMHAFAEFKAAVVVLGQEAEKETKRVNELHQRTLKETNDEWKKQLPSIREGAIDNYMRRFPRGLLGNSCGGQVPGDASGAKVPDGPAGQPMAPRDPQQDAFIGACARDAARLGKWQEWATKNQLQAQ
ncbi:MAG: hypothetical protein E6Q97_36800 [Desulfurellales bacterium]|nr:MAG: hypothetical protein E6Q97_36800 [Desulfurellales bacterium]